MKVYAIVPLQVTGDGVVTVGVIALPQASVTVGGVGATASEGQLTVEAPFAGRVKSGAAIV